MDADALYHEVKDLSDEAFITLATNARLAQRKTALQKALTVPGVEERIAKLRSLENWAQCLLSQDCKGTGADSAKERF